MIKVLHRLGIAFLFVAAGCSAGEGDVCQIDDDCSSGLMCCKASAAATERGTCETMCITPPRRDAGPRDSGPPPVDSGGVDSGPEDSGAEDAGEDAGEPDAGEPDSGPQDSGVLPDTGVLPDAGL